MVRSSLVAFLTLSVVSATALDLSRFTSRRSTDIPKASHVATITSKAARSSSRRNALWGIRGPAAKRVHGTFIAGGDSDEEYLTKITIGGQTFEVIIDTGSSDTWLAGKGFDCFDLLSNPIPTSECAFGTAGFDIKKSRTFVSVPNKNFNISYGDGEFLTGVIGDDTVTVAGLTVRKQEIGVVTKAAWEGDGVNTGLLGLAYPGLTSAFDGTDPDADSSQNLATYNPFFFNAVAQKSSAPYFSIALNRGTFSNRANSTFDSPLGYLAFGGIAPVPTTGVAATVPVQGIATKTRGTQLFYYQVDIDSYVFPGSKKVKTAGQAILDTGTTLNYVPTEVAKAYNAAFRPPAKFVEDEDTYYVDCNAIAPSFSATIGGRQFTVDGRDNILPSLDENGKVVCISGTQDGGEDTDGNIFILGDVFLHNVVSTFNIQANTVTLHERTRY